MCDCANRKEVKVLIGLGQSNMVGVGFDPSINGTDNDNNIFYPNFINWEKINVGENTGFTRGNGKHGVEISLLPCLEAKYDEKVYFIKVSRGGTSLAQINSALPLDWDSNSNNEMIDEFKDTYDRAIENLYSRCLTPNVIGAVWIQSEADCDMTNGDIYDHNTAILWSTIRNHVGSNIPFYDTLLPDWNNCPDKAIINAAKISHATTDGNTTIITTGSSFATNGDNIHYSSQGLIDLGNEICNQIP